MTTETKVLGVIFFLTIVLLFGGVFFLSRGSSEAPKGTESTTVSQIDYSKGEKVGSDSAKVKLVEFSDLQCPACLAAEPSIKKVRAGYPGEVQLTYRHFPLPQHIHGREAATFAEAAGEQGKFWEMHDKLFDTQSEWSGLSDDGATAFFLGLIRQLGLDENKVKQAITDNVLKSRIDEDVAEGQRLGVNSTPTFFVNGRKLNLQAFDDLNTVVASELKK